MPQRCCGAWASRSRCSTPCSTTQKRNSKRRLLDIVQRWGGFRRITLTFFPRCAFQILAASQKIGATVLINGSDASDHVEDYLRNGFRCVLVGEAEFTLSETVQHLLRNKKAALGGVAGLAYLSPTTGEVVHTARRSQLRHLDALPFPARDLIDTHQYRDAWKSAHGYFSLNLVASRGCPYRCNWCAKPIYGYTFSARSPRSVAEEMRQLKREYNAEHLWFADDIFGLQATWVLEFAEAVETLDAAVPFKMQSRVDLMAPTTTVALRRSGCAEVWMGVESGSQKILNAMEKGIRVEQVARARRS